MFGLGHIWRPEPAPKPPEDEVSPPITPPEALVVNAPITLFEPPAIDQPVVMPPEPAVVDQFVTALEPAVAEEPLLLSESSVVDQPVTPPEPVEIGQTIAPAEPADVHPAVPPLSQAEKSIFIFMLVVFAIGVVILATDFFIAQGNKSVRVATHEGSNKGVAASPVINAPAPSETAQKALGMELSSLNDTRRTFAIRNTVASGVVVTHVDPISAAANSYVFVGNVIIEINGEPVKEPADVVKKIQALQTGGKKSALFVLDNGYTRSSVMISLLQ